MIVPLLPLFLLMAAVFSQQHDRCFGHYATGATIERAHQRPTRVGAGCRGRAAASSIRGARTDAPNARETSQERSTVPLPAARPSVDSDRTTADRVMAAVSVARRLTGATSSTTRSNPASPLVVLLMARPEITSASDLAGKDIAIDGMPPAAGDRARAALNQAGATGVKLTGSRTRAVSRLVKGEVAAAVLGLVSPDAAGSFPEVAGFRTLRIPLAR